MVRAPRRRPSERERVPRAPRSPARVAEGARRLIAARLRAAGALAATLALVAPSVAAATDARGLYADACAGCHGTDGRGAPRGSGITVPLPDFTDCTVVTGETTANWVGLVRSGGRFLGLSEQMPAFRDVLTEAEIRAVVDYLRTFCATAGYPLGDLNLPRSVFVEKAFPEDEAVGAATYASARHERVGTWETALEKRIGTRGQIEVAVPGAVVDSDVARRIAGLADLELSYKHALVAAPSWGTIVSGRFALDVPTGNRRHGVGAGTPVVVPELLSGHALGPFVVQTAIAAELPGDETRADRQMVYAAAVQYRLGPYRKNVVVGAELQQTQALDSAVDASTVLGPSLYLPLSRRGHVALGIAAQLPVAGTRPYDWLVGSFLLWDYADGPFWAW